MMKTANPLTKTTMTISSDTALTLPTTETNKNAEPAPFVFFVAVNVKTLLWDVVMFYTYLTLFAVCGLGAAAIKGVLPFATEEDVHQLCSACLLIVTGFLAQYLAAPSAKNYAKDFLPLWLWQCVLMWGLTTDVFWHALSACSLSVTVLLAFLFFIHMWLMVVVSSAIHYLKKTQEAEEHIVDSVSDVSFVSVSA